MMVKEVLIILTVLIPMALALAVATKMFVDTIKK